MIKILPVGPLNVNCSIIVDEESGSAIIVDPGSEGEKIIESLNGLKPVAIVNTHGHVDHVGQVAVIKEYFDIPFMLHKEDVFLLKDEIWQGFGSYVGAVPCPDPDEFIEEDKEIRIGNTVIKVIHTPGHTPGGCCFYLEEKEILIAGDLLFKGSVGRWDLPGGNLEQLKKSLIKIFSIIPDETVVVCGHNEETTIGHERMFNPFLRELI